MMLFAIVYIAALLVSLHHRAKKYGQQLNGGE
jgi:hypothetical protein